MPSDVDQFRGLRARLTADKTVQKSGLQVFGFYLCWRGRVVHRVPLGASHAIMVSSDADWATGVAFPIGTKLSNVPKLFSGSFRDYHEPGGKTSQFN